MLLEYATDGHLLGILREKKRFIEEETKVIVKQILQGT